MRISLDEAVAKLQNGEVVAIPTETVYGLAADATNESALRQIYAIKQRPADNPLIVHIGHINQVNEWAAEFPPLAQKLASAFWPGPFTLVLPAKDDVSSIVRAGEPTVALRIPSHPLALQLLKQSGLGLAAPSANKYTQLSPTTAVHVGTGLGECIPVLDGGACQVGIESTIVSVINNDWQLLRHGMIAEAEITAIAGKPALAGLENQPKAPGQHLLHYSPKTPIKLFDSAEALMRYQQISKQTCAVLLIDDGSTNKLLTTKPMKPQPVKPQIVQLPKNPAIVAEQLYGVLHHLDTLNVAQLLVQLPPDRPEWLAILDRLTRAAHHP
ncbi:L-threonylcarbamoyladenylate synthase [Methylotenera versatilis]|uniref:L-threonylcarbamoyladenylate synthase n=1 Tax=Methylotenera versatilis TaxID=1055487 RepID=UPI0006484678|nr:L-threonylcarbamoyladenylate synthase [Methylotenera versatilis]